MEKQSVFIAVPTHTGDLRNETVQSLLTGVDALDANGIGRNVQFLTGCSIVTFARDMLVGHFLAGNWTDIVWVDADIQFHWRDLLKLLEHPADIVAGAYRFKRDLESYPIEFEEDPIYAYDPITGKPSETGLIPVKYAPLGFCRMRRSVLEKMREYRKDYEYQAPMFPGMKFWGMFDTEISQGRSWGEDVLFCRRWREMGGKVYIDPWLRPVHVGNKSFPGCIGEWLRSRGKPETPEQLRDKLMQLRDALADPELQHNFKIAIGEAA